MASENSNFIRSIIRSDLQEGRYSGVVTRFPPEPNGYLHIGHAKAVCVSFGLAADFDGHTHLRFDDTNPVKEDAEYVQAIMEDIRWLGFDWGEHLHHASDYFPQLYAWAVELVERGKAFVDSSSESEIRELRGTVNEAGRHSPFRERSVNENLKLLEGMRRGDFEEGAHVLRAKIDMAHANMKMRDPLMYRILNRPHDRTGDAWHIYPMYDYAHGLSDAIEGITHSICTLEFDNNRALYDWFVEAVGFTEPRPHQYEMARLSIPYTMLSKRKLLTLVEEGVVTGWDDPRMPTLRAARRKGVPPTAIRRFVERVGVARSMSVVDPVLYDNAIRDELNPLCKRLMAVLDPLEIEITNWPEGRVDWLDASLYPHDVPLEGTRRMPFTGRVAIEREDFIEDPPKKWHRLAPGREVRLRYGYLVTCTGVKRDSDGEICGLTATYDPESRGGVSPDGRKVRGTLHWVSADEAASIEVRTYEPLFLHPSPDSVDDVKQVLNPNSLHTYRALAEPAVVDEQAGSRVQFERLGYFYRSPQEPGWTRIVPLKDSWTKPDPAKMVTPAKIDSPKAALAPPVERVWTPSERAQLEAFGSRGVGEEEAVVLMEDRDLAALLQHTVEAGGPEAATSKWVVHGIPRDVSTEALTPEALAELVTLVETGELTNRIARDVMTVLLADGGMPSAVIESRGWTPIADEGALISLVEAVIAENPGEATAWRGGKDRLVGFFVGQIMKRTQGRADARRVQELLAERRGG